MKYCQEKLRNNWEYMLYKLYEVLDIKYMPFFDKFFKKIDLKPPEPSNEDEGIIEDINIDENKEENKEEKKEDKKEEKKEEEKKEEYKEEVIPTEINIQENDN